MAISPADAERLARKVRQLYEDAETRLLEKIAKKLDQGMELPHWQQLKAQELSRVLSETNQLVEHLSKKSSEMISNAINESYHSGVRSAISDLSKAGIAVSPSGMAYGIINTHAVDAMISRTLEVVRTSELQIVRKVSDIYQTTVIEASGSAITGVDTRRQATQRVLNRFAAAGISTFIDRSGRNWDLASYAEMAVRTTVGQAAIQGHVDRLQEGGYDLVIVSDHPEECPQCRPWERKILSSSGNNPEYPSLADATAAGLFHPGCGHTIGAYIEGLTVVGTPEGDPEGYKQRQKQRYMERQVRHWKKREAVAITPEEQAKSKAKVKEWRGLLSNFVDEHDRKRKPWRESIKQVR